VSPPNFLFCPLKDFRNAFWGYHYSSTLTLCGSAKCRGTCWTRRHACPSIRLEDVRRKLRSTCPSLSRGRVHTRALTPKSPSAHTCHKHVTAVWQLQPKVVQTVQQHVSYEFFWISIGHVTIFSWMFTSYCVLFSCRVGLRIRVSVWLVNCYARVLVLL